MEFIAGLIIGGVVVWKGRDKVKKATVYVAKKLTGRK